MSLQFGSGSSLVTRQPKDCYGREPLAPVRTLVSSLVSSLARGGRCRDRVGAVEGVCVADAVAVRVLMSRAWIRHRVPGPPNKERGFGLMLAEFDFEDEAVFDALTWPRPNRGTEWAACDGAVSHCGGDQPARSGLAECARVDRVPHRWPSLIESNVGHPVVRSFRPTSNGPPPEMLDVLRFIPRSIPFSRWKATTVGVRGVRP